MLLIKRKRKRERERDQINERDRRTSLTIKSRAGKGEKKMIGRDVVYF